LTVLGGGEKTVAWVQPPLAIQTLEIVNTVRYTETTNMDYVDVIVVLYTVIMILPCDRMPRMTSSHEIKARKCQ